MVVISREILDSLNAEAFACLISYCKSRGIKIEEEREDKMLRELKENRRLVLWK